jgi:hypothetical protein
MIVGTTPTIQEEEIPEDLEGLEDQEDLEEIPADLVEGVLTEWKKPLYLVILVKKCVKYHLSLLLTNQFIVMIVLGEIQVQDLALTIQVKNLQKLTKNLTLS